MGPIEVWAKPGTIGLVDERLVLAWSAAGGALLAAVSRVSGSEALQFLALLIAIVAWRTLQRVRCNDFGHGPRTRANHVD